MTFFTELSNIMQPGITVNFTAVVKDGQLTVGVVPSSKDNNIPMLMLSGTPEELDAEFFNTIKEPIQRASGLITNTVEFNQQLDEEEKDLEEDKKADKKPAKSADKKKADKKPEKKEADKPEVSEIETPESPKEQSLFP